MLQKVLRQFFLTHQIRSQQHSLLLCAVPFLEIHDNIFTVVACLGQIVQFEEIFHEQLSEEVE